LLTNETEVGIVTGGSRGIGRATVRALVDRGWQVMSVARTHSAPLSDRETQVTADLGSLDGIRKCLAEVKRLTSRVDLLVNNAGAIGGNETVGVISEAELLESWCLHALAPFSLTRGLLAELEAAPAPAVVNVGSVYGRIVDPEVVAYGMAKAGLDYLTGALALALGPRVRVNEVVPGHVDTDMTAGAPTDFIDGVTAETALHRIAAPSEVVDAILYLGSTGASFVTGASLRVDGGFRPAP
jgi:NAD(P)-dependent dehydrogenase (short-subunit alcohol dehydrogenase family)